MQSRGQTTLLGAVPKCMCGFHTQKATASSGQAPRVVEQQSAATGPPLEVMEQSQHQLPPQPTSSASKIIPSLSKFTKPRFGGSHISAAKPNLSVARRPSQVADQPSTAVSSTPTPSTTVSAQDPGVPASVSRTTADVTSPADSCTIVSTAPSGAILQASSAVRLHRLWSETLPPEDHRWIASRLFKTGPKGKPELQDNLQLWYYPPQPALIYNQAPAPDRFFCHALLLWMPYKLWKVKVLCPNSACGQHLLTGGGLHKRARQVLDIDRMYNMVTETLICTKCKASHVSWSQTVLQQLDLGHRSEFRVILTRKYACDMRVIRLLRERGLGNSPTRVIKQLRENHSEEWLQRLARYTTQCVDFLKGPGVSQIKFQEPPEPTVVPSCKWLLTVCSQDILTRLDEIHARITSTYGSVLKMDSTKKITKKLAGTARGTGLWLTSVGNEFGQVLISVLTAQEGAGLDMMVDGLVKRYQQASVDPAAILYVDCGCCTDVGETKLKTRFRGWPDLMIRLDIWHFMRRIAMGCTTDAHQLYPIFMSRLSACIFEWDAADVSLLRKAKRELLVSQGWPVLSDEDVIKHLTREELALHCRRRTCGEETTILLLERLLTELLSSKGKDSLGVPLLDRERMEHIWNVQKKHVKCIQDPPGVVLYTETGSLSKGGVLLKTYRCARGSTSLESFHLHINRFIPGTSANSLNFQIYLLEGLHRWNQDREAASLSSEPSALRSYTGELVHCVNSNYEKLFGRKVVPTFCPPASYTGELIGVQYLFQQTGQALQDMNPDSEQTAELIEDLSVEEREEDEGFCDISEDHTITDPEAVLSPPSSTLVTSSATSVLGSTSPSLVPDPTQGLTLSPSSPGPSGTAVTPVPSETSVSTLPSEPEDAGQDDDEEETAVDYQNVPGYQHVDQLAEYLVDLRAHTALSLTNQEANTIIALWQNLDDRDKERVMYDSRCRKRLLSGRFKVPKRSTHPGVESTIRLCWVQAALLLIGLTVAVWWRPSSSDFALSTQAPKEKARDPCRDGL
ncbi:unnamed protein product [Leuciscus chuanchicus]